MSSAATGNTNFSVPGLLKQYYRDGGLILTTFRDRPVWAMITKKADSSQVDGSTFQFAVMTNDVQSRNASFTSAQAQASGLSAYNTNALTGTVAGAPGGGAIGVTQFSVPRVTNYAYANISTQLMLSTRTKRGAFDDAVTRITDSALNVLANDMEISMLGGGITSSGVSLMQQGFISTIGSATTVGSSTGALTLAYALDSNKFSVGMELDLYYNNAGTVTKRTNVSGSGLFVGSIDRTQGILYIVNSAGTAVAITSVFSNAAVGDFIAVTNDPVVGKIASIESWIPFGGPVSDSPSNLFMGVNRNSGDVTRLSGSWIDATGAIGPSAGTALNIEDALILATQQAAMFSSKQLDTIVYNYNQHTRLLKSNMSRTLLPGGAVQTEVPELSFKGIEVDTATGPALCLPDRFTPTNRIYGLHMPSWQYIHLGDPVEMFTEDGNQGLREQALDAVAYRFFSMGNLVCDEPSANVTINCAP